MSVAYHCEYCGKEARVKESNYFEVDYCYCTKCKDIIKPMKGFIKATHFIAGGQLWGVIIKKATKEDLEGIERAKRILELGLQKMNK